MDDVEDQNIINRPWESGFLNDVLEIPVLYGEYQEHDHMGETEWPNLALSM